MACTSPLGGYRTKDGRIVYHRISQAGNVQEVQCGQCNDCRIAKAREWAIRAMHEAQMHAKNAFITLTYNEEHLPENGSLDLREWQNFAKRMREAVGPFRFLHVGEYGAENNRPHYHALIFGQNFDEDRAVWKECDLTGRRYYRSPKLAKLWPKGFHDIQDLSREAANYVCQYAVKKIYGTSVKADEEREKRYQRVDPTTGEVWQVAEETWSMSKNPGLGKTWFDKYGTDVFPHDHVIVKGRENRPPRYYLDLLKTKSKEEYDQIKTKRTEKAKSNAYRNEPVMRRAQAAITQAKLKLKPARKLD